MYTMKEELIYRDPITLSEELIKLAQEVRLSAEMTDVISVVEAAMILNCTPRTVRNYISQGKIKRIMRGCKVGVSRRAVLNYLNHGK